MHKRTHHSLVLLNESQVWSLFLPKLRQNP